ncbi:MAG: CinA family protein [Deltaproteobacteria bacterium]|nr:CinA family protein [Deltaproteobacteria bacterium]
MKVEEKIGRILRDRGLRLAISESCTGGLVCHSITNVSGSSVYFEAGIIAYSNQSKVKFLNVGEDLIRTKGAVSEEVAAAMAEGIRKAMATDIGISVTGIAGPTGGTPEKPVGLVYVGLSTTDGNFVRKLLLSGTRTQIKQKATRETLKFLLDYLQGKLM